MYSQFFKYKNKHDFKTTESFVFPIQISKHLLVSEEQHTLF